MSHGAVVSESLASAVLERLRVALGAPELTYRRRPTVLAGGNFSSVYRFDVDPCPQDLAGEFVLRMLGSSEQVSLEAGLHAAAATVGLGPRLLLWEASAPEVDGGYLVMERLSHRSYLRGVEPARFALDLPKLIAAWPRRLAAVVGALGQVDPDAVRRALERHGVHPDVVTPGRHVRAVQSALGDDPAFGAVVDWLHEHQPPPPERLALVHGDLWPGNVFLRGRTLRLIDWTRGGVDDPALDVGFAKVGFALMPEPFPPPPPIRQLVHGIGRSITRRISANCDRLVGGGERVRYYEALRCAVELSEVVTARTAGEVAGWEHGVPALVRHLQLITGEDLAVA